MKPQGIEEALCACPDCKTLLVLRMTVLTDKGVASHITTCPRCNDGITIRFNVKLTADEFKEFYMAGVPVMHYGAA